ALRPHVLFSYAAVRLKSAIISVGQCMTKDELRAELERQKQRFEAVYGGEVVTYASQPEPDRKPWRRRPNLLDEAFQEEIRKEVKRQADLPS
ncbi:hypothetical protein YO5_05894, partial [Stutzerimonas stutzeri TS44]